MALVVSWAVLNITSYISFTSYIRFCIRFCSLSSSTARRRCYVHLLCLCWGFQQCLHWALQWWAPQPVITTRNCICNPALSTTVRIFHGHLLVYRCFHWALWYCHHSLGSSLLSPVDDAQPKVGNTTAYGNSALHSSGPNLDHGGMAQYFVQYAFVTRIEKAHLQSQIGVSISVCDTMSYVIQ